MIDLAFGSILSSDGAVSGWCLTLFEGIIIVVFPYRCPSSLLVLDISSSSFHPFW
jgi:hypothetical protein